MSRSLLLLLTFALVGAAQGCRICDSPYDYCGPVMPCGEGCGCGPGGCGHSHYDGGYVDSGYSGGHGSGHGGCATCGNGGGHAVEYSNEYEGRTVIQGQPTPAPTPAPMPAPPMNQGRRASPKPMSKASYEAPMQSGRPQQTKMQAKPAKMTPYPATQSNNNRMANNGNSDSGRGLIVW